jgi:hypothetical protein
MLEAKRTLVKSGPELWAEVADAGALARHLAPFGTVRIARTEPDSLVVWEGERAAGQVALEPAGFGTRVTLRAEPAASEAAPLGRWQRLLRRRPPAPAPLIADDLALRVLTDALDALGRAHHRPYSRA